MYLDRSIYLDTILNIWIRYLSLSIHTYNTPHPVPSPIFNSLPPRFCASCRDFNASSSRRAPPPVS